MTLKKTLRLIILIGVFLFVIVNVVAFLQARSLVNNPLQERSVMDKTPEDFGLTYENVQVTTSDNLVLNGWYMAGQNSALIIMQHGYKWNRIGHLEEAPDVCQCRLRGVNYLSTFP